jgi:hypothetical protein
MDAAWNAAIHACASIGARLALMSVAALRIAAIPYFKQNSGVCRIKELGHENDSFSSTIQTAEPE